MSKKISVFGLGYVGAVTAACLAETGNSVLGVDVNAEKVAAIEAGKNPILEPRVEELIAKNRKGCRLHATTDPEAAVLGTDISFICVGTPSQRNGKPDLKGLEHVAGQIGASLRKKSDFHWVVLRSTVLPGTTDGVLIPALEKSSGKKCGRDFGVCFIPEFLREGTAVADFFDPPFTVLGAATTENLASVRGLFAWAPSTVYETVPTTAEFVKYVCNSFHALKVAFSNEIGTLAKALSVDSETMTKIWTSDTRLNISTAYTKPGFAFGGSCLPKDLRAMVARAREADLRLPLIESILPCNVEHIDRAVDAVLRVGKRKVGMLGLSFKAGTDDLRESPLVHLAKRLLGEGCELKIWDDNVALGQLIGSNRQFIQDVIPHIGSLLRDDLKEVVQTSEVIIVGTKAASRETLAALLNDKQHVVDLVHLGKAERPTGRFSYEGICW
jgi:GDP-mannose 6-dehydrogenase